MFLCDYLIVFIPLIVMIAISLYSRKYVKSVSDFLAAGRVAGRYVIAVAGGEAACGLISIIALIEVYCNSGFGYRFWTRFAQVLALFFALTGFCTYRFRETRAMTIGQFLEMRYSRSFRICAAVIQALSGILNYAIFPAVGARFLIYYLDLPTYITLCGVSVSMYCLMLILCIGVAAFIACLGGQITIMVSDCVQGIISYPLYMILICYFFWKFSWSGDMLPTLMERPAGESFLNPYDISKLRDFNLVYVLIGLASSFFSRLSWAGCQGYKAAAKSAHEEKMGGLLGTWRGGFSSMMVVMIALVVYTYMHNPKFENVPLGANHVNCQLARKAVSDIAGAPEHKALREKIDAGIVAAQPRYDLKENKPVRASANKTVDNYSRVAVEELRKADPRMAQTFRTIHNQMLASLTMREMLPAGITGIFAVIMIFLMISTDNTYMHSWGSILIQDILLPFRETPFTPRQQLNLLRCGILFVGLFAFLFSLFFAQMDFIMMFFQITGAIWVGGGTVITLGLYWRRGTTAGAFAGLFGGAAVAVSGMLCQNHWAGIIYPWLDRSGYTGTVSAFLSAVSRPLNPYVVWKVTPLKFPVNSMEIVFLGLATSILLYVAVSLLSFRKPFNLEKMLHRGKYADDGKGKPVEKINLKKFIKGLIGITPEYTRGDKALAWSVFLYSLGYGFGLCFLVPLIWNAVSPWPKAWWGTYFWITSILVTAIVGVVSTFWFAIGGMIDLVRLFRDLAIKKENMQDDGRVVHEQEQENEAK